MIMLLLQKSKKSQIETDSHTINSTNRVVRRMPPRCNKLLVLSNFGLCRVSQANEYCT